MEKKPLYLCKNLTELQKITEMKKLDLNNVKISCQLLDKLFEKFEKSYLDQDEELAYVYIMRFLVALSEIKKMFRSDLNYINAIFNNKKIDLAFDKAGILKMSLKSRYELVQQPIEEPVKEPVKVVKITPTGFISAVDLFKSLKAMENILIVDTRPVTEFVSCHIRSDKLVNIPANELKLGCSIVEVNKLLESRNNPQELSVWHGRHLASFVVLVQWVSDSGDDIKLVKDAIYKWDAECSIKEPVVLESGLYSFATHYPTMVTNSKYKGPPDVNQKDHIVPEDIQYPDWDYIEAEKKRKKDIKKQEEAKKIFVEPIEINENELEMKFKEIKSFTNNTSVGRNLKLPLSLNESVSGTNPNIVVDRSKKPTKQRDKIPDEPTSPETVLKQITNQNIELDLNSSKSIISPDRSLKPNILREISPENVPSTVDVTNDEETVVTSPAVSTPSEIPRLSNNSRTPQDRTNFAAKGGAKSIPPPTNTEETKKPDLPPWIAEIFDKVTNEHFFVDRRNNKRYRVLPEELLDNSKENAMRYDQVETLKDHSVTSKGILKPISGSSLKRSTSQPNLSEELVSPPKPLASADNTITTNSSRQYDPPSLNRQSKPSHAKSFTEFSASRLNNFNPSYKTVTPGLTGLRNMGNTCYMNSVVQALSNTKFLTNYILTSNYRHDINRDNPLGYGGEIVTEFAYLTTALWTGTYREVSPSDFKRMIDGKNEMFRGSEQHDSQEFLLFLLDGLHEDLNRGSKAAKIVMPPNDEPQSDSDRAQLSWQAHIAINDSVIVRIFQGQYRSKVTCDHCQMSSVTFDAFMYLSLPLVPNHNRCTLEDCLRLFLAEERMTGASQWFCPKCKTNRNAKKKIDIWKLPPYLLIHLKRFSCTGQYRQKLNTFVDFPMDTLSLVDILKHTKQSQKHEIYHLYAVSNHHGNMESGHYTSYCKNVKENEWYNYDDDVVTKIRDSDVKTPSAYILFYESYNLKQATYKN